MRKLDSSTKTIESRSNPPPVMEQREPPPTAADGPAGGEAVEPTCRHLPGGNRYDNIRIDLRASYDLQDRWLAGLQEKKQVRRSIISNWLSFCFYGALQKTKRLESLVMTGLSRSWFEEFEDYWRSVLDGRPLTISDFHQLRFHYRRNFQRTDELSWENNEQHLQNWQRPPNINLILTNCYDLAIHPIRYFQFFRRLQPGMRVLEYGCSMAPAYRTYRRFFNDRPTRWVLADIPNFSYHFARYQYARDRQIEQMVVIPPDQFDEPLNGVDGRFDAIVIMTVFEHLHRPRHIAEYLLERLNPGGLLVFDYIKSDSVHLDSRAGLDEREETLEFLASRLLPVYGRWDRDAWKDSLGLCIGAKK